MGTHLRRQEGSEVNADAFVDRMASKFRLLAEKPELGRLRDDLMKELRSFPFQRYVIFYRAVSNGIEALRMLHNARDVKPEF